MIILTFDTSCINAKQKIQELNQLEALQRQRLIKIVISTSVEEEHLQLDKQQPDQEPYRTKRLDKLNTYDTKDTAYWVLGLSRLGISTKVGSKKTKDEKERMAAILFPNSKWGSCTTNQIRDIMALHTHWTYKRDAFVTLNSRDFIGRNGTKRNQLKETFGILVMNPSEALAYVESKLRKVSESVTQSP